MGVDDRPADRQPHLHSAGLRGVESVENVLEMFRINARPRIAHRDEDAIRPALPGADQQVTRSLVYRAHRFGRVQNQVRDCLEIGVRAPKRYASEMRPGCGLAVAATG